MRRYLPFIIVGAVLILTVGGGLLLFRSHTSTPLKIAAGKPGAEPPYIRGAANARVTLEEFGDFQCPPCSFLAATLLKVEHDYAESVRVVFRQFPLAMHPHAMTAACAAEAAGLQGRFWEMHDLLFQNAMVWGKEPPKPFIKVTKPDGSPDESAMGVRAVFSGYASKLGLDVQRFNKDMDSEQVKARISLDQERASSIGVDRTPMLFIDGVQIPFSSFGEKELRGVIDAALSGKALTFPSPTPTSAPPQNPTSAPPPIPFRGCSDSSAGGAGQSSILPRRNRSTATLGAFEGDYSIAISFGSNSAGGYCGSIFSSAATTVSSMTRLRIHLRSAGTIHQGARAVVQLLITSS